MTFAIAAALRTHRASIRPLVIALPSLVFAILTIAHLGHAFAPPVWHRLLSGTETNDMQVAILFYSALPRLAVALLAGACLGLASTVLQVVLRNPIAEPATLGMSGGASLAMTAASLWAPALVEHVRPAVAFMGSGLALLVVLGLAMGRSLSPQRLILGGLVVSLLCGTLTAFLTLLHHDMLQGIFIWNAGSLVQNGWGSAARLSIESLLLLAFFLLLARALTILHLADDNARSLGLSLSHIRLAALVGTLLTVASVASAVGVVGFVGLAAATLGRAFGARSFASRLFASAFCGAMLLAAVDQGLQLLTGAFGEIPAGGLTALLGAPLMLWLLPRLAGVLQGHHRDIGNGFRQHHGLRALVVPVVALLLLLCPALMLAHDAAHWHLVGLADIGSALSWRGPRTLAGVSAGFLLGVAGVLTQRLTGNPLASPEVLGISTGAALGALASILFLAQPDRATMIALSALGALLTLTIVSLFARRGHFSPERMLLSGIAVSTLFSGLVTFLLTTGDPRMRIFVGWMAGSVARATASDAETVFAVALLAAASLPFLRRWLDILPLGDAAAQAVGIHRTRSRAVLFVIIAIFTAAPTMLIGPLSFIGLMAPHIVRLTGVTRAWPQAMAAGIAGALIVLTADLAGRTLLFPYEIPAGLMASLIGAPFFLWGMHRSRT